MRSENQRCADGSKMHLSFPMKPRYTSSSGVTNVTTVRGVRVLESGVYGMSSNYRVTIAMTNGWKVSE